MHRASVSGGIVSTLTTALMDLSDFSFADLDVEVLEISSVADSVNMPESGASSGSSSCGSTSCCGSCSCCLEA